MYSLTSAFHAILSLALLLWVLLFLKSFHVQQRRLGMAMWMRQHANMHIYVETYACQNPRGQTFRLGHAAYNRPYSLSCVVDILCICVFYVFYLIVFAGQANLCCGATPSSLVVLFDLSIP